jgi:hypothetical protein
MLTKELFWWQCLQLFCRHLMDPSMFFAVLTNRNDNFRLRIIFIPAIFNAISYYFHDSPSLFSFWVPLHVLSFSKYTCLFKWQKSWLEICEKLMTTWASRWWHNVVSFEISVSLRYKAKLGIWTTFCGIGVEFLYCEWDGKAKEGKQHSDVDVWLLEDQEQHESVALTRLLWR